MTERKTIITLVIVILALIVGIFALYMNAAGKPELTTFVVGEGNEFLATGTNLNKVEIWAVPTGTNITEKDHIKLEDMMIVPNDNDKENQMWVALIPKTPVVSTEIYAKAYDSKGNVVGTLSLPYTGATEVYNAVWNTASSTKSNVNKGDLHKG